MNTRTIDKKASSADQLPGAFFGVGSLIQTIDSIIFAGPNMLANLGMPRIIAGAMKTVVVFVVGFDVAEAVTGRQLS